jgi:hypothetical protein
VTPDQALVALIADLYAQLRQASDEVAGLRAELQRRDEESAAASSLDGRN